MASGTTPTRPIDHNTFGPAIVLLGVGMLLTGLGTAFLGPVLPLLASQWHITDQQSGLLITAKFVGAFLGGMSVHRLVRFGVLGGYLLAGIGFAVFAMGHGMAFGIVGLFVSGYGVGLGITATNILIGRRYTTHTGAALSTLNFFWSLGAVLCGFLAALLLPRFGLHGPMLSFGGLFLLTALAGILFSTHREGPKLPVGVVIPAAAPSLPLPRLIYLHFCSMLFLYGGLETCISAWLTTYSLRIGGIHLLEGQSAVVLFWTALTAGRVLGSGAMRAFSETAVQRVGLTLSALLILGVATTSNNIMLSVYCVLLGLGLAPFFPPPSPSLSAAAPTRTRQAPCSPSRVSALRSSRG
ncbi:MFS transporter [Granulicella sp. 5B5]|uniref:MFS transporter n=1 Tax=Granulicella sp. 5B5 TaxID=1617967 RepID=UPI0015F3A296|nr:MFS transporter [Granulicella sp. 5B5]QMV17846.1 MFS transporter [Granulicella sp. 5B5]